MPPILRRASQRNTATPEPTTVLTIFGLVEAIISPGYRLVTARHRARSMPPEAGRNSPYRRAEFTDVLKQTPCAHMTDAPRQRPHQGSAGQEAALPSRQGLTPLHCETNAKGSFT